MQIHYTRFLSTIGLVVGVAALVAILSLGDGLEKYARNQISTTTSLEGISVSAKTKERVDGVSLDRETVAYLQVTDAEAIAATMVNEADLTLSNPINARISVPDDTVKAGIYLEATMASAFTVYRHEIEAGRAFTKEESERGAPVVVLAHSVALRLAGAATDVSSLIGRTVRINEQEAEVVGIIKGDPDDDPLVLGPHNYWVTTLDAKAPSRLLIRARDVSQVPLTGGTDNKLAGCQRGSRQCRLHDCNK